MKSHQISAFFLLMTVLLSSTLAQHDNGPPHMCCFIYFPGRLRMDLIAGYERTNADCPKPGIIFYTTKGNEVCVDPSAHWVQQVKQKLDQRLHQ